MPDGAQLRFLQAGIEINLGSIGKGYALDRAGELLAECGVDDYLLHGGNSSVLARGAHAELGADGGWSVGVRDPLHPARRLGQLRVRDRALATSGSGTQFFVHHGKRYGHMLDPRTGQPAEGVLSATVLAPTAAEADALSTAFYVMGPEQTAAYCDQHPEIAALMFCPGTRARWRVIRFGMPSKTGATARIRQRSGANANKWRASRRFVAETQSEHRFAVFHASKGSVKCLTDRCRSTALLTPGGVADHLPNPNDGPVT